MNGNIRFHKLGALVLGAACLLSASAAAQQSNPSAHGEARSVSTDRYPKGEAPEPLSLALIAGGGAAIWLGNRRRRGRS